jgi:uncharacterized protein (DUF433 family)
VVLWSCGPMVPCSLSLPQPAAAPEVARRQNVEHIFDMRLSLDSDPQAVARCLAECIEREPDRLGGEPVFRGTRVPVKSLFDHLNAGDSLETFLDDFPGVTREQVRTVLELAEFRLLGEDQTE